MVSSDERIGFRGGPWASVIPLATFVVGTAVLVILGAPAVEGMILLAMLGISLGMGLSRNVSKYSERVFSLMANRVAMITVGPLANTLRKRHDIHKYRSANLLDTISCSFPYTLPYAATIVAADAIQRELALRYDFVQVIPWAQEVPFIFYGMVLFPIMIIAVITGYGRVKG